jgi:hypothetical protein
MRLLSESNGQPNYERSILERPGKIFREGRGGILEGIYGIGDLFRRVVLMANEIPAVGMVGAGDSRPVPNLSGITNLFAWA